MKFEPCIDPTYHPGKCARLLLGKQQLGVMGELHPMIRERFELPATPLLAADFDLEAILAAIPAHFSIQPVPVFPPVLEDLAVVVDEAVPAEQVAQLIQQAAGETVAAVHLFDVFRGEQIGSGKKSLAYSLTYQSSEHTLTDDTVAQIRNQIVHKLEVELGGKLRS